jgi:two-component sensor histidine kinase
LGRAGRIGLSLQRSSAAGYQLLLEDDGVGLPPGYTPQPRRSLGMTLLHGFSRQLGGELTLRSDQGLKIQLTFRGPQLTPSHLTDQYADQRIPS